MAKHRNLLIVVADGEHARFVRVAPDNALHTERSLDSTTAHKRSSELASDRPGASLHSDASARHAATPRQDPHALAKQDFAHALATQVSEAASEFDELVLVAPAQCLNEIRARLGTDAAGKLVGTLAKDLVKTPDHELQPHLHEWVHPVVRAR